MARVSNTLIGPSSGRVGNAVFSTWKGINVLKEKPASVANPNTDAQKMRRSALRQIVVAFRQNAAAIRAGFKKLAIGQSEWNAFASINLKNAFDYSSPPTATLLPGALLTGKGTISSTAIDSVVASEAAGTIEVDFADTVTSPGQSLTDKAMISVYNVTKSEWTGNVTTANRSTGTATIPMPESFDVGDSLRVYLSFTNSLSGDSSDSSNTTATIVS